MAYLALSPVAVAVYNALNVASLQALVGTRLYDRAPQAPTFPFVWIEVQEQEVGRFGGAGLPEVDLRVHVFSTYEGMKEAQDIAAKVVELLRDQVLTVTGYAQAGTVFYDRTRALPDELLEGVRCVELVVMFRVYVEES